MPRAAWLLPLTLALAPLLSSCKTREAEAMEPIVGAGASPGVAVVELFTSEGCSSCPPADALLGSLVAEGNPHLIALAFQVDYWNSIGWTDPYSSEASTERQREYATAFGTTSVYTPQMVVGGVDAFNGSDREHARAAIATALGQAPRANVTLKLVPTAGGVHVQAHVDPLPPGNLLRVALVERGLVSEVRAGENAGKTLRHEDVVRSFMNAALAEADAAVELSVPAGVRRDRAEVVAFVQAARGNGAGRGMPILGAARAPLGAR
jgi:hypothetical protein